MATVDLPFGTVRYRTAGPDSTARPVVFVHGLLSDGGLWAGVADALARRGIGSYLPDWPLGSHTIAMRPDADLSPRGIACGVPAFIEALGLSNVTLVGNSDGGAICQFAIDIDHRRIGGLVLTNCPVFEQFPPAPLDLLTRVLAGPWLPVAIRPLQARWIRHSPLGYGLLTNRPIDPALTRRWIQPLLTDHAVRRDIRRFLSRVNASGPLDLAITGSRLGSFNKPVRIVWGAADPFFKPAFAHRLAAAFPNADVIEIAGGRTLLPLDEPHLLAAEITRAFQPASTGSTTENSTGGWSDE